MTTSCTGEWRRVGSRRDGEQEVVRFGCSGCPAIQDYVVRGSRLIPLGPERMER